MTRSAPEISVVIPVYNEAPNLRELFSRVVATLEGLGRSFEVVTVDDGSSDGSLEILRELRSCDGRLRIIRLSRNFGQQAALYAAFEHAQGEIIVTIDADLQNPPEELVKLVSKLEEGYEVVQGWREVRQDSVFRRAASKAMNAVVSYFLGVHVRDLGCGMKAYRREVIDQLRRFTHHARYVPAEVVWLGAKMAEVKVTHNERAGGKSKYSLWSLLRLNFVMITSVTTAPIKFIGLVGWIFALVGFAMAARIITLRILYGNFNQLATVAAIFFTIAGIQMIATGFMCEYISRIFIETQDKPYYVVKEIVE